jgi:hypothetical protein
MESLLSTQLSQRRESKEIDKIKKINDIYKGIEKKIERTGDLRLRGEEI